MVTVTVETIAVSAIANLMAKKGQIRRCLVGLNIKRKGGVVQVAASDGTIAGWYVTEPAAGDVGPDFNVILGRAGVETIVKLAKGHESIIFEIDQGHAVAKVGALTVSVELVDGTFPELSGVVPSKYDITEETPVCLNIEQYAAVSKVSKMLSRERESAAILRPTGRVNSPVLWSVNDCPCFGGVIGSCRVDLSDGHKRPI
jgi:DNA polymerase III sliding clamp (beta) subunit (PCNA family)